jgi:aldose 1-epimerase
MAPAPRIELRSPTGPLAVTVDPSCGGRLASIVVEGHELLVTGGPDDHPMLWGSFPMVPFAGRVREGRFSFGGQLVELPVNLAPHAIHGCGYDHPWSVTAQSDNSVDLRIDLGWPLGGWATQHIEAGGDGIHLTMTVGNDSRPMPAQAGWHPWFRRPVVLELPSARLYERDGTGIPTGRLVDVPPGPLDDCLTALAGDPVLRFVDGPRVVLRSSCDHWVVYTEPEHALCVEPQSGPPDQFNHAPTIVRPGHSLTATFSIAPGEPT